jgi:hypothetical protein
MIEALIAILATLAGVFGYKYQKAKRDHAEDRAEAAEEAVENAHDRAKIDAAVNAGSGDYLERMRLRFTRKE